MMIGRGSHHDYIEFLATEMTKDVDPIDIDEIDLRRMVKPGGVIVIRLPPEARDHCHDTARRRQPGADGARSGGRHKGVCRPI